MGGASTLQRFLRWLRVVRLGVGQRLAQRASWALSPGRLLMGAVTLGEVAAAAAPSTCWGEWLSSRGHAANPPLRVLLAAYDLLFLAGLRAGSLADTTRQWAKTRNIGTCQSRARP